MNTNDLQLLLYNVVILMSELLNNYLYVLIIH